MSYSIDVQATIEAPDVPYTIYCPHCGIDIELRVVESEAPATMKCRICEKTFTVCVDKSEDG